MITDARDTRTELDQSARFLIIGSGPAGMTLARKLADLGSVMLVESGGFDADPGVQALCEGESVGLAYSLRATRARQFGGTSNLWAGWCTPFDADDFGARDWVPGSAWPFGAEELEPYYSEAAQILNLDGAGFDARVVLRQAGVMLPFDEAAIVPSVWRFGAPKQVFGQSHRAAFEAAPNVTVLLHATVVDIRLDAAHRRVSELVVRTMDGRQGRIAGDVVVLACGGIETVRLLLNADSQQAGGLGNANDLVGRYFMEHPHWPVPSVQLHAAPWLRSSISPFCDGAHAFMLGLGLPAPARRAAKVLNARAHAYRVPGGDDRPLLGIFMEQAPHAASRVTLSSRRDVLGMRRVRLDWRLTALDYHSAATTARLLGQQLARANLATLGTVPIPGAAATRSLMYTSHHIGTTRMARTRAHGVVDAHCRVHELANLFIVGSSVFPSSSWANPTFTIVVLALRLAQRLHGLFNCSQRA